MVVYPGKEFWGLLYLGMNMVFLIVSLVVCRFVSDKGLLAMADRNMTYSENFFVRILEYFVDLMFYLAFYALFLPNVVVISLFEALVRRAEDIEKLEVN